MKFYLRLLLLVVIIFFSFSFNVFAQIPDGYSGCAGIDPSHCNLTEYDPNQCLTYINEDNAEEQAYYDQLERDGECLDTLSGGQICAEELRTTPWNDASCVAQRQGCFIPHPELGSGNGVCLLPQVAQDYSCSNRPANGRCGPEYTLCFNSVLEAGVGAMVDCGCLESTTDSVGTPINLCLFLDEDAYDQEVNSTVFTDDHCPVCPAGYSASTVDGMCWRLQGGDIGNRENVTSFISCTEDQVCRYTQDGSGCEDVQGGGCLAKRPVDSCGGERPIDCEAGNDYYCCETLGQCVSAGGEQQMCIRSGDLTPDFGDTSCRNLYPEQFPQLCRTENWDWLTLEEGNYCCYSQDACEDLGGQERGVLNDRPVGEYDICISNLEHNGGALDLCNECYSQDGIWTAIGCIDQNPRSMVEKLIAIGMGIVGGVFLLRVLSAAFMLTTSQGDVKKTTEAKQMITEAVVGVIVIIFSVTLLQFFGSDILKIPGFGS